MKSESEIVLGIDATNIRHGGGITHLSQLLRHANLDQSKIDRVVVWSNSNTLNQLPNQSWLKKKTHIFLNSSFLMRTLWQIFRLGKELKSEKCGVLFVPGASFITKFKPVITMHQNLLPFEDNEVRRYGFSFFALKLFLLRFTQSMSFKKSEGIIYLSYYSKNILEEMISRLGETTVIPHGIEKRFFQKPKRQLSIKAYSENDPFKIIYVSSIDLYKHQWNVIEAVKILRSDGYPIILDLYGKLNKRAEALLSDALEQFDKNSEFISLKDELPFEKIHKIYHDADLSIFASSCETFGQIILESMASGLPICCSNRSSMRELLSGSAKYFDPLVTEEIVSSLKQVLDSDTLRKEMSMESFNLAKGYNWELTSKRSFDFFTQIYLQKENKN